MRHDQVSAHPSIYIDISTSHSHYSHPTTMFNQSDDISLHHMVSLASIPASQWSIDSSNFDQSSMPTHPPFARFLPWYQPALTHHSYHMGDPFVHGYSHMGNTFEGLTGRMRINEIGERMHEARFLQVQVPPQEDDILTWIIQPRRHTLNHVPAWQKGVEEVDEGFSPLFCLGVTLRVT